MQIVSINTAPAELLETANGSVMSGIRKRPRDGTHTVHELGLEGDEQVDLSAHGGMAKAIYAYPVEHYAFWQTVRAQASAAPWGVALPHGALGENLTISGLLEEDAFVGDVLRFAHCELVISEPRYPCFKFNAVMGFNQASKLMAQNGWCGFYLAVRVPGTLVAGESFERIPGPRLLNIREQFKARMKKA